MMAGDFTTVKRRTIETDITRNVVKNKTTNGAVMSQVNKVLDQKLAPLSRIDSKRVSNKCSPFSKIFVYRKNPKPTIGRKIGSFQQGLGKIDPRSGNSVCSKGVCDTILESSSAKEHSKAGDNGQNTGIVNKSGDYGNARKRSHKKVKHQFPDQLLNNVLLVKKKDGGNRPCINLKALKKFIP